MAQKPAFVSPSANLSETVETLLAHVIDHADAKAVEQERQITAHIPASEAFVRKHG